MYVPGRQLWLVVWKNWLLKRRKPLLLLSELILPCLLAGLLLYVRTKIEPTWVEQSVFPPKPVSLDGSQPQLFLLRQYQSLVDRGQLNFTKYVAVAPMEHAATRGYYSSMNKTLSSLGLHLPLLRPFDTEQAAMDHYLGGDTDMVAAIIFEPTTPPMQHVQYKIRAPVSLVERTEWWWRFPRSQIPNPRDSKYVSGGFSYLQSFVSEAITRSFTNSSGPLPFTVALNQFPYPQHTKDIFALVLANTLPLVMVFSWIASCAFLVNALVHEKEQGLLAIQHTMGLHVPTHTLAWALTGLAPMALSAAAITLIFKAGNVLSNTSTSLFLLLLLLFGLSVVCLSFFVASLFSRANLAASVSALIYFATYLPYVYVDVNFEDLSVATITSFSLFSTTAFALGVKSMSEWELAGGVQWSNLFDQSNAGNSFSFGQSLIMLAVDSALYLSLALYIHAVLPGEYGVSQPPHFPLLWLRDTFLSVGRCCRKCPPTQSAPAISQVELCAGAVPANQVEVGPSDGVVGVSIVGLTKQYGSAKPAVHNLTLDLYRDQITALLGHNGAGKTTTMSVLMGLYPPTQGTALIGGRDVRTEIGAIRQHLGVCPQHNVLFDHMTVQEHLDFYVKLKGCYETPEMRSEALSMLEELGLSDKLHALAKTLSGGMKRKLSVILALSGGSTVVILDEPTAGMDPVARRHTWELLLSHRAGCTILLSTHHMDEADVLGDRIALMADGELKACGTSLYLKSRYGKGYYLTIAKGDGFDWPQVADLISSTIDGAKPVHDLDTEARFVLPTSQSNHLGTLLGLIEANQTQLGIASYGVSATTLEDVFLEVAQSSANQNAQSTSQGGVGSSGALLDDLEAESGDADTWDDGWEDGEGMRAVGWRLAGRQFGALMRKRALWARRDYKGWAAQLLVPSLFVCLAMGIATAFPTVKDPPPLTLDTSYFPAPNYIPYAFTTTNSTVTSAALLLETLNKIKSPGDLLESVPDHNMTQHLLSTRLSRWYDQFGALSTTANQKEGGLPVLTAWWNGHAFHGPPAYLNMAWNMLLAAATNGSAPTLSVTSHPLPLTRDERLRKASLRGAEFIEALCVVAALACVPASFAVVLVHETSSRAKHQQHVTGVGPGLYMLATMVWDQINYLAPTALILLILQCFHAAAYTGPNLPPVVLLLLLYGWGCTPLMYVCAREFTVSSTAYVGLIAFNLVTGIFCTTAAFVLDRVQDQADLRVVNDFLGHLFLAFPGYCVGRGLMNLSTATLMHDLRQSLGLPTDPVRPYSPDILGRPLVAMAVQGFLLYPLVFALEFGWFTRLSQLVKRPWQKTTAYQQLEDEGTDSDVIAEAQRIDAGAEGDVLVAAHLRKVYGSGRAAVSDVSFGVGRGQCFGLLGANGAGKTTTFGMLTGAIGPDGGDAYVDGASIVHQTAQARSNMGYCPQFDALLDLLTGREMLELYARLRGYEEKDIPPLVNSLLTRLQLAPHADKITRTYSGGTKRKLSVAVALVGNPSVVLFDEPTAGMDPGARRHLWAVIGGLVRRGQGVVLTSHSMDECELLCTRLAIMANGKSQCIGSPQYLKNRHCHGYSITAKLQHPSDGPPFVCALQSRLPACVLEESHSGLARLRVEGNTVRASALFVVLEEMRVQHRVEDYVVSQTTLEQVFLHFAGAPVDEE